MRTVADWVIRYPWPFIVLFLGITALFGTRLPSLEIDPEVKNQLPEDMPARVNVRAIEDRFGGSELLMVVLEAPDVLEPDVLRRLEKMSDEVAAIDSVDRVISLFTLTDIQGQDGSMTVEAAVPEIATTPEEKAALRAALKANDLAYGNVISRDFTAAATIALLSTGAKDSESIAAVEAAVAKAPGPGTLSIGGMPKVRTSVSEDIRSDMRRFLPLGLLIILGFLYVCFRQARGVILPFSVVVMSVIVAMGLIPIMGWKVQMVTVILPVILLAVANDYGIHLLARYQEENVPGADRDKKVMARSVLEHLGMPVLAAGITTMAGLLCLTTHIVVPAAQLGVLASVGVLFALLCSLGFVPAVLAVLPVPKPLASLADENRRTPLERLLHFTAGFVSRQPRAILAGVVVFSIGAASGIRLLQVDTNPINYYEEGAPVEATARLINDHFGGSTEIAVMVEGDIQEPDVLERLDHLDAELKELPQVGYTMSISQVVRTMNRALHDGDPAEYVLPDSRAAVAQYFLLYSMGGEPEDFERMVDFEYEHALFTARINSLSTQETSEVVELVEAWAEREGAGLGVVVGGFGAVFADLVDAVVQGQVISLSLSLSLVIVLVAIAFRSLPAGVFASLPLFLAIPILFGLMGYLSIELNVVTAMLSSIMIGVGIDYTIHFLWRYRDERRLGLEPDEAVLRTLTTAGRGIVFNAFSVVVGFSVLLLSNFLPVKFFGFLVVVSISACLIGALVLLPALCLIVRPRFLEP